MRSAHVKANSRMRSPWPLATVALLLLLSLSFANSVMATVQSSSDNNDVLELESLTPSSSESHAAFASIGESSSSETIILLSQSSEADTDSGDHESASGDTNSDEISDSTTTPSLTDAQWIATGAVLNALRNAFSEQLAERWVGPDFCLYHGVTCFPSSVIVYLPYANLHGVMPAIPSDIRTIDVMLSALVLTGNEGITGELDSSWNTLPQLYVLDLSGCSLSGALPEL